MIHAIFGVERAASLKKNYHCLKLFLKTWALAISILQTK